MATWTQQTKNTTSWKDTPKLGGGVLQSVMTQNQDYYIQQQQSFGSITWTQQAKNTTVWSQQTKH